MKIEDKLVASVINGLKALYGQEVPEKMVQLQKTKKEFEGHLTLVVFPFLKMSRKGPEQTAQEIGEYLKANEPAVAAFNVIKGFLNLTIASATWIELLNEIQSDDQFVTDRIEIGIVVRAGGSGGEQKRCRNKKQNSFHDRRVSNVSCIFSVIRLAGR